MAAAPSPSQIQQTVGVLFDGFVLAMIGYGLTFFQTYVYFSQYPGDHRSQKSFVAAIFSLDTASAALVSKSSLNIHILLSVIALFGVQLYYSFRVWKLGRNISVTSIAIILSTIAFSLGLAMVAMILKEPLFARFASVPLRVVSTLAFAFALLASLLIFSGLAYFLRKFPAPKPTSLTEWFDTICRYLIARGWIVVMVQLACLISLLASPGTMYWIPLYIVATKAAINSLLFNSRPTRLGKGTNEEDPVPNRTLRSRIGNTTASAPRFATVSEMFDSAPESSNTTPELAEMTRTVKFERALNEDSEGISTDDGNDTFKPEGPPTT
ncbi:hypothetical protein DFH06DRAFT_1325908 [Mycena polygramma]|nr:hypothetical protein DFH06DRAFT_1325908 [Mycena polygramma]